MSLNSYKQWQMLNETFGAVGSFTLGLSNPQSLGIVGSQGLMDLEEAKKQAKKKKMDADIEMDDEISDEDDDDMEIEKIGIKGKKLVGPEEEEEEEEEDGEEEEEEEEIDTDITKRPIFMKKKCKKAMKKAMKKGMKKEDQEWWNSINNMLLANPDTDKCWDGFSRIKEDALLPPVDSNQGLADMNPQIYGTPQPGEVGFAPQTKFGL